MAVVLTVVTVSLLGACLAAFVVLADLKLNSYGACTIDINNGQRVLSVMAVPPSSPVSQRKTSSYPRPAAAKPPAVSAKWAVLGESGPVLPTEEPTLRPRNWHKACAWFAR